MLCPSFQLLSPSLASALLVSIAASSPSQVWPATLGGFARRRPCGHIPVRLPRWCPLPLPREWGSVVTKRSCTSTPPPCVFHNAPWKRSVLRRTGGGSRTRAQRPCWRTPVTPTMERQGFFLNVKEEAVHTHWGERGLLQWRPEHKSGAGRPHLLQLRLQQQLRRQLRQQLRRRFYKP
jgi:hypothetical protein